MKGDPKKGEGKGKGKGKGKGNDILMKEYPKHGKGKGPLIETNQVASLLAEGLLLINTGVTANILKTKPLIMSTFFVY